MREGKNEQEGKAHDVSREREQDQVRQEARPLQGDRDSQEAKAVEGDEEGGQGESPQEDGSRVGRPRQKKNRLYRARERGRYLKADAILIRAGWTPVAWISPSGVWVEEEAAIGRPPFALRDGKKEVLLSTYEVLKAGEEGVLEAILEKRGKKT